jgi:hypothetical protein
VIFLAFDLLLIFIPNIQFLLQLAIILGIVRFIRGWLGKGMLAYAVSGIFIYIFVFKYTWLTYNLWLFYLIISMGIFSYGIWLIPIGLDLLATMVGKK